MPRTLSVAALLSAGLPAIALSCCALLHMESKEQDVEWERIKSTVIASLLTLKSANATCLLFGCLCSC